MNIITIIIFCLFTLYLSYRISKKFIPELPSYTTPILFIIKLCFAYTFYHIYTYHDGNGYLSLDAGVYFEDSKALYNVFFESKKDFFTIFFGLNENPDFLNQYLEDTTHWILSEPKFINDTRNIIRLNTLIHFMSNQVAFVHFICISFLSFIGLIEIFQWLKNKSSLPPIVLLLILTLAPSLAFWSSNNLKEPMLILGVALLIRAFFDTDLSLKKRIFRIILGLLISLLFKPYVLISFLVATLFFIFSEIYKNQWINLLVFSAIGILFLYFTNLSTPITNVISDKQYDFMNVREGGLYVEADEKHFYHIPYKDIDKFEINEKEEIATQLQKVDGYILLKTSNYKRTPVSIDNIGESFPIYLLMEEAKSKVDITYIHYDYWQLVKNIPEAIFNSFLQPIPRKDQSKLLILSFIENLGYLLMMGIMIIFRKKCTHQENRRLFTLLLFAGLIAAIVGWTSPISGAIVRYIIPAKLVLLIIFALQIDFDKLRNKLNTIKS